MPEKAGTYSWVLRLNPTIHWSFKVLTLAFFLGILIVWGIDGLSFASFQNEFILFRFNNQAQTQEILSPYIVSLHPNLTFRVKPHRNLTHTHQNLTQTLQNTEPFQNLTQTLQNLSPNIEPYQNLTQTLHDLSPQNQPNVTHFSSQNVTNFSTQDFVNLTNPPNPNYVDWISVELEQNYTSNLLAGWLAPGGEPCKDTTTVEISIPNLDGNEKIELSTGYNHEFVFQALDESGKPHCLGGDYFETDLSGEKWKSRPPIKDFGNGTYSLSLQVHQDFDGDYNLTIILLYRHFEGLKFSPQRFVFDKEIRKIPIKFLKSSAQLQEINICDKSDFERDVWSGRWTRHANNESCSIDYEGRYRCLEPNLLCPNPWCLGSLAVLESNGWTYSTHCSFRLFSSESAWKCLNGRWIFFWGDSNHCDTIRNMLLYIFKVPEFRTVPRRFDMNITNPRDHSQVFRITSIFNGHENESKNYNGLDSLQDNDYRDLLRSYFSEKRVPDTVVINSGLHDGVHWRTVRRFVVGAEKAAAFWAEVMGEVRKRGMVVPEVIYRSTVATGGYARRLAFNPNKMEVFNGIFLEKLRRFGVVGRVVDHFDMTYPWHFDNRCNDGVHYGRAPANMRWRDGQVGHQYFVDLMLGHVLLNALCAR